VRCAAPAPPHTHTRSLYIAFVCNVYGRRTWGGTPRRASLATQRFSLASFRGLAALLQPLCLHVWGDAAESKFSYTEV
jgi:hypothetical protein